MKHINNGFIALGQNNKMAPQSTILAPKKTEERPISILKNKVHPKRPSFPDKCLTGYENLKKSTIENPRTLASVMNDTCQQVLESGQYIKNRTQTLDWNKAIKGKDFYQRTDQWMYQKEMKIEYMRHLQGSKEVEGCTFSPNVQRSSPLRQSLTRCKSTIGSKERSGVKNTSQLVQGMYSSSSVCNLATSRDMTSSYAKQYEEKLKHKNKSKKCYKKSMKKYLNSKHTSRQPEHLRCKRNNRSRLGGQFNNTGSTLGALTQRLMVNNYSSEQEPLITTFSNEGN